MRTERAIPDLLIHTPPTRRLSIQRESHSPTWSQPATESQFKFFFPTSELLQYLGEKLQHIYQQPPLSYSFIHSSHQVTWHTSMYTLSLEHKVYPIYHPLPSSASDIPLWSWKSLACVKTPHIYYVPLAIPRTAQERPSHTQDFSHHTPMLHIQILHYFQKLLLGPKQLKEHVWPEASPSGWHNQWWWHR